MTTEGDQGCKNPGGQSGTIIYPIKIVLAGIEIDAPVGGADTLCTQFKKFLACKLFKPLRDLGKKAMAKLVLEHGESIGPHDFA